MEVKDIRKKIAEIRDKSTDNESAHAAEDKLWQSVLSAIAKGHPRAKELARAALRSTKIEFDRWYS